MLHRKTKAESDVEMIVVEVGGPVPSSSPSQQWPVSYCDSKEISWELRVLY